MWPRVLEVAIGAWLLMSPFIFQHTAGADAYNLSQAAAGTAIIVASLLAIWPPAAAARGVTALATVWLIVHGYFSAARPGPPAAQNEIVVGLLLILFVLLPNDINAPPTPWRPRTPGR